MLQRLRISNLGIIDESVVELADGLCVLTGETGAGKTMIITGLNLLRGERADSSSVRAGADRASVDGIFAVATQSPVLERARDAGAEMDEPEAGEEYTELLVARTIQGAAGSKRNRSYLGGRAVPVSVLTELADDLVAVHGQSEQVLLTSATRQRRLLDGFGGALIADALADYRVVFDELAVAGTELEEITSAARARRQEADLLRLGLAEIEGIDPQPGEDHQLRALSERLEHAGELLGASSAAHAALLGTEDAVDASPDVLLLLSEAKRQLDLVARLDPSLAELSSRVSDLSHLVVDLGADLAQYGSAIDADPVTLATTHERRATLNGLLRKYGGDVDEVLHWAATASRRLLELDDDDDRVNSLREQVAHLSAARDDAAATLTTLRRQASDRLASAVTAELAELSMPGASFSIHLTAREPSRSGADHIEFLLAPNPGSEPRPLGKGASGGELSRVMLAIEVATVATTYPRTQVFDEVDAGVGGKAAVQIGRRLSRLAAGAQVIVVTHLPQVAAYADQHLVVRKSSAGSETVSGVLEVSGADRIHEVARMLAGNDDSSTARMHAEELLAQAAAEREALRSV